MLKVIVTIIFFGMLLSQILLSFRFYKLVKKLERMNIYVSRLSRHAALKDLKAILISTDDEVVKMIASKSVDCIITARWLFFGSSIFIFLVFFFNGIFNLHL